jgi:hypothetical protein
MKKYAVAVMAAIAITVAAVVAVAVVVVVATEVLQTRPEEVEETISANGELPSPTTGTTIVAGKRIDFNAVKLHRINNLIYTNLVSPSRSRLSEGASCSDFFLNAQNHRTALFVPMKQHLNATVTNGRLF